MDAEYIDVYHIEKELISRLQDSKITQDEAYRCAMAALDAIEPSLEFKQNDNKSSARDTIASIIQLASDICSDVFLFTVSQLQRIASPCHKTEVIIDALQNLIYANESQWLKNSLVKACLHPATTRESSKRYATCLTSLPEIVANKRGVHNRKSFHPRPFYIHLTKNITAAIDSLKPDGDYSVVTISHIVGRIAFVGHQRVIWDEFIHPNLCKSQNISMLAKKVIFTIVVSSECSRYLEHVIAPLFLYYKPSNNDDDKIYAILESLIVDHQILKYLVCRKFLLMHHYARDYDFLLFNIFNYLKRLAPKNLLLVDTLIELIESWADHSNIILRSYSQSYYLCRAISMATREVLQESATKSYFVQKSANIREIIFKGMHHYIGNPSGDLRRLGMATGKILLSACTCDEKDCPKLDYDDLDENSKYVEQLFNNGFEFGPSPMIDEPQGPEKDKKSQHGKESAIQEVDDDDDDLIPYDTSNDTPAPKSDDKPLPLYPRDCIEGLMENENSRLVEACLQSAPEIIKKNSSSIGDVAVEFVRVLLNLDNHFEIENFVGMRMSAMCSLCTCSPTLVAGYLLDQFNATNHSIRHRLDILEVLVGSAYLLSSGIIGHRGSQARPIETFLKNVEKSTQWRSSILDRRSESSGTKGDHVNKFSAHAGLFFFGILESLQRKRRANGARAKDKVLELTLNSLSKQRIKEMGDANKQVDNPRLCEGETIFGVGENEECYLLGRTFFSLGLILKCSAHLPIACKMSSELLECMKHYKYHVEPFVRRAVLFCFAMVLESTPRVYLTEHLNNQLVEFNCWLDEMIVLDPNFRKD